ncbi:MAG TPA: hypothetical protein VF487_13670 [Chitinophagaceae bacterium]
MKYRIIYFFVFVFASCSNQGKETSSKNKENNLVLKQYFKTVPPYASLIYTPEDTLVFGFNKGSIDYDTSWTLLVSRSGNIIRGYYNQLLPYTVTGFNDYMDESTKLLYHEGFSFEINKSTWDSTINLSGLVNYNVKDSVRYRGCPHCPNYTAYYDSKIIINSKLDNYFVVKLDSLLRKQVINNLFEKKRNPPIKLLH